MKKIKYLLIVLLLIPLNIKASQININSEHAILYNLDNNEILLDKNSEEKTAIASLTKIMTTIVAIENIDDIKQEITIPSYALEGLKEQGASTAGFKVNDKVTYEDLLYAIMLPSGADAAKAIAYYISGSEEEFIKLMNNKAQELNLKNTKYYDTTGLNDNNYSTVKDISSLLKYALNNTTFNKIFTTKTYTTTNNLKLESTQIYYTKKYNFDTSYIKGAKTGFTDIAGYCLASIAEDSEGNHFLLVTTKAPSANKYPYHFLDAINIYDNYIDNYHNLTIYKKNSVILSLDAKFAKEDKYEIKAQNDFYKYVENETSIDDIIYNYQGLKTITPFTKKGKIGTLTIKLNNDIIKTIDINYDGNLSISLIKIIEEYILIIIPIILIISLIIVVTTKKKRKKRKRHK